MVDFRLFSLLIVNTDTLGFDAAYSVQGIAQILSAFFTAAQFQENEPRGVVFQAEFAIDPQSGSDDITKFAQYTLHLHGLFPAPANQDKHNFHDRSPFSLSNTWKLKVIFAPAPDIPATSSARRKHAPG
jgi:hypothetical protein